MASIEQLFAVLLGCVFLTLLIPYWGLRWLFRSRFEVVDATSAAFELTRPQFRLRDLLVWTSGAAVVFAILNSPIGRSLREADWSMQASEILGIAVVMAIWGAKISLVAIPTQGAALASTRLGRKCAYLVPFLCIVSLAESAVYSLIDGMELERFSFFACFNLGIAGSVFVGSVLLRACGYRLRLRVPRRASAFVSTGDTTAA